MNPFHYFDAIYCINLDRDTERWQRVVEQAKRLGFDHRLRRLPAVETPDNHHVGCALSHRQILATAQSQDYENVLVLEDDVLFGQRTLSLLSDSLEELRTQDWELFYLGGHDWDQQFPMVDHCNHLRRVDHPGVNTHGPTCTHAIAYHRRCFERILAVLPDDVEAMSGFLQDHLPGIDQLLAFDQNLNRFVAEPHVASQPPLLARESDDFSPLLETFD